MIWDGLGWVWWCLLDLKDSCIGHESLVYTMVQINCKSQWLTKNKVLFLARTPPHQESAWQTSPDQQWYSSTQGLRLVETPPFYNHTIWNSGLPPSLWQGIDTAESSIKHGISIPSSQKWYITSTNIPWAKMWAAGYCAMVAVLVAVAVGNGQFDEHYCAHYIPTTLGQFCWKSIAHGFLGSEILRTWAECWVRLKMALIGMKIFVQQINNEKKVTG